MNILFYCNEYPPFKSGGIGTVTKIVAEALVKRGHNIYIIGYYPTNTTLPEYSEINGVHIYRYNLGYRDKKWKHFLFMILVKLHLAHLIVNKELVFTENKIETLILNENIDILEITDYYDFNLYPDKHRTFKQFCIPTVLRIHGSVSFLQDLIKHQLNHKTKENDSKHFNRCDHLCAVSEYSLKYIQENFDTSHFKTQSVIYNPIEEYFLNPTQSSNSNDILFIGKLTETKGCYSLLKAFNICAEKFPNIQLRLVGNGNIKKAKSYIDPQFTDRVHFLGFCNREQIKKEIDNCIFACIPSFFETFGMVAIEIMGRQRTLIFTERTSGKEIILNDINGYTVNPENIEEIAQKINILYTNQNKRESLSTCAYNTVLQNFTTMNIIEKLENLYFSIKQ